MFAPCQPSVIGTAPMLSIMPAQKKPASAFGARLIALRKARSLTQIQFAELVGVTQPVVSYYEAKADVPAGDLVAKFAYALKVSTDELLGVKALPKIDSPTTNPEARRYWRRFQQLMELPEKDQRAVFRLLDTMSKARQPVKGKASVA